MKVEDMQNENHVKAEVRKILAKAEAWSLMHVPVGYGKQGAPDFLICLRGRMVGLETKFRTNRISAHQARELTAIHKAGGVALIVNEGGLLLLERLITELVRNPQYKLYGPTNLSFDRWGRLVKHEGVDWEVTWGN